MVFPSVPIFLDPPNWQQQPNHHQHGGSNDNPHLQPQQQPTPPPQLPPVGGGGGGGGSGGGGAGTIRPGSMADRARLAKLPQPETALKCPRCESTNTKFCYFNNYSLSQPRHFCKTCRRYWTRGGALRNVPVGGGCRRNKRSKGNRSKSPVPGDRQGGSTSGTAVPSNSCTSDIIGHFPAPPPPTSQLPFLPPLHHLADYGAGDIGLNFGGIHPPVAVSSGGNSTTDIEFPIGSCSGGGGQILSGGLAEQWRLQQVHQFPFLAGLEPPSGLYPFEGEGTEPPSYLGVSGQLRAKALESSVTHLSTVKIEENQGLNLSRNFLGIPGNDQYWSSNTWNDLSGFTSSTTSHLL